MNRLILEIFAAVALTMAAILALAAGARASDIMVDRAFARASATPVAKSASVYLTLSNGGTEPDRLIAVATDKALMAHVHATASAEGVMSMQSVDSIDLAPGASVALRPGGLHIMLMGLRSPLKKGETLDLVLTFERSGEVKVVVPIGGVAADGPDQAAGSSGG